MPELLLEVGCEELPAAFVRKAYTDLLARVTGSLGELYGQAFGGVAYGTPRRLIVSASDIPIRQPDTIKEVRGPAVTAAYDDAGNPTQSLQGFCRSNGVDPADLRKDATYVWLTKTVPGQATVELLADVLPRAIRGLTFEKSMRWGSSRLRFARPIRWLLAAYDGAPVAFEIEGVWSGLESRGHRFYSPETFGARSLAELLAGLRDRNVEPDVNLRAESIRSQALAVAGGVPDLPEGLVDENAFLTEWPTAIVGEFRLAHLNLPGPVLTTAMAKHEKMFPVRDGSGNLTNRFVFIRNSGEDDSVRRGAEWVLNARLDDAQFFYRDDLKHDLDYFLEKTAGIVFQEKLGTVRQRADRLAALGKKCASKGDTDKITHNERDWAATAGKFAKADLSTGLVSDMASLQGIVGGEYARRQQWPEPVCWAISSQYNPALNANPTSESERVASYLIVADHVDKLAGYLGLGLAPTGSSDPYGLRRSAQILIDVALRWPTTSVWDFSALLADAISNYEHQQVALDRSKASDLLDTLFGARYEIHFDAVRYDILEAAIWNDVTKPQIIRNRLALLEILALDAEFVTAAVRPINLVEAEKRKGWASGFKEAASYGDKFIYASASQLAAAAKSAAAEPLAAACDVFVTKLYDLSMAAPFDAAATAAALRDFAAPIKAFLGGVNSFLDSTMVNDKDPVVRQARLELLWHVASRLKMVTGDFTKLVLEG